jgi:hypothetical protein
MMADTDPKQLRSTALVHLHGANPWGMAWCRRGDENGIDLNRNFIDFTKPLPENPTYDALANCLVPERWTPEVLADARDIINAFKSQYPTEQDYYDAIAAGQYRHDRGIYYGGTAPSWSHRAFRSIVAEHAVECSAAGLIDLHTGLGQYGEGRLLSRLPSSSSQLHDLKRWFGDKKAIGMNELRNTPIAGSNQVAFDEILDGRPSYAFALEFGTLARSEVHLAVRADCWLHGYGQPDSAEGRIIRAQVRAAFCPDESWWRRHVAAQGVDVFRTLLNRLESAN